ncbi:MAG: AAA family ATPase, partial [Bacteroidota bacterium]
MTSADIAAELTELQELLELEKEADLEFHRQKILNLPLEKRVKEGYSWYNITVAKSGYTIGDRAFVI